MKSLVIIPAYNEQDNILFTVRDLKENAPDLDYIVINDCSTDNTLDILKQNSIPYLNLPIKLGIGGGVQAGYRYAYDNGYDIAIQFDGDGQHDARYLNALIAPIVRGEVNIVVGSRFIERNGFQSSAIRRFGISFLSGLIHCLCGIRVLDVTSGMRAADKKAIAFFVKNYAQDYPEPEAILATGLAGLKTTEIPVQMRERQAGVSSINAVKSVYYMIKVSLALILSRISHGGIEND